VSKRAAGDLAAADPLEPPGERSSTVTGLLGPHHTRLVSGHRVTLPVSADHVSALDVDELNAAGALGGGDRPLRAHHLLAHT
jgi:hypothetical protein